MKRTKYVFLVWTSGESPDPVHKLAKMYDLPPHEIIRHVWNYNESLYWGFKILEEHKNAFERALKWPPGSASFQDMPDEIEYEIDDFKFIPAQRSVDL